MRLGKESKGSDGANFEISGKDYELEESVPSNICQNPFTKKLEHLSKMGHHNRSQSFPNLHVRLVKDKVTLISFTGVIMLTWMFIYFIQPIVLLNTTVLLFTFLCVRGGRCVGLIGEVQMEKVKLREGVNVIAGIER